MQVKGAVKAYKDVITLRTRCELKQQLLMQGRLLWSTHAINSYNAHTRILLDDEGAELDMGIQDNDFGDSLAYGPVSYTHLDVYKRQIRKRCIK